MGIFTRVRDIISSNINAMLDKAEDPEKLVKLMIQEMEDTLVEIKASCAGAMASKKRVERASEEARGRAQSWAGRAELAVNRGREDLAREALLEKRRFVEKAESLEAEGAETQAIIDQYGDEMRQLEEKLNTAREKQRLLIQRHIHAQRKRKAKEDIRKYETSDVFVRFEQFENRIERMEAEADLVDAWRKPGGLDDEFTNLAQDEDIERELRELKARTGHASGEDRPA